MHRRDFLQRAALAAPFASAVPALWAKPPPHPARPPLDDEPVVMTVTGPVPPDALGLCLAHEHVLSRFGTDPPPPGTADERASYQESAVMESVVPYLRYLHRLGCRAIADATAIGFGRSPSLLRALSEASDVRILMTTGIYGAADDRYVPAAVRAQAEDDPDALADALAAAWAAEWAYGIGASGVRPGFIKTGVDGGPLSAVDRALVVAGARTHRTTGLTLAVHTSANVEAAEATLRILDNEGVRPDAWVWVHAHQVEDPEVLVRAAERGGWVSLDGLRVPHFAGEESQVRSTLDQHLRHVLALRAAGRLDRVLLAHDGSSHPAAYTRRPYDALFTAFLPVLEAAGLSEAERHQLVVENPAAAFTVRPRLL